MEEREEEWREGSKWKSVKEDCKWETVKPKSKQGNTINLTIFFSKENEKGLLRCTWDSNPPHTAQEADTLPTELQRQIS